MALKLLNFILFQAAWLGAVMGAARGWWWAAPAAGSLAVLFHVILTRPGRRELALMLGVTLLGTCVDAGTTGAGVVSMASERFSAGATIVWFASLWALFSTTLNVSLAWMQGRTVIAAFFGILGGPLAYLAGERLGAVTFSSRSTAMLVFAVEWGLLTPGIMWTYWRVLRPRVRTP